MKKVFLCIICIVGLVFGAYSTVLAVNDKALYDENMVQITGFIADDYYSVKTQGHLEESKNEAAIAMNDLKKHSFMAGCMYFVSLSTGGSLIFITIKNRKENANV